MEYSTPETLKFSIANKIATITLNRPEVHNAFDEHIVRDLTKLLAQVNDDPDVRIVMITHAGKNFSSGADLKWMKAVMNNSEDENFLDSLELAKLMNTLYSLRKPTIAMVRGATYGGGIGLLACCDIVFASESAVFCFSEAKLGIVPSVICPYVINMMGERAARRYFLTCERFGVEVALRIGLITESVSDSDLESKSLDIANKVMANSPNALAEAKDVILNTARGVIDKRMVKETALRISEIRSTPEAQEGMQAFFEKRKPFWQLEE